jgi:hypothetical protein
MADPDGAKCLWNREMAGGDRARRGILPATVVLLLDAFPISGHEGVPCKNRKKVEAWNIGAGDRDRTGDIQLGKLAFYR